MASSGDTPRVDTLRSPLGRARGLGAARAGSGHWWAQNLTSIALVPLSLWFICGMIRMIGASRQDVVTWLSSPLPMVLMLALIVATFHHLQLGVQVVIEDYVPGQGSRLVSLLLLKGACILLALLCIVSVLRLAFGM
ncbi:MAG TPA: succinate dehydrogenase, hydrophobic membrane anchor protein [Acetobacteraceae bacterium]|jgi:succinate dehydrogenase / fumarate reductase, membrane anchor subunit|nr:succinate dehydrogenase, hydrophobic membrane anchor protein [Acetobacteraceae bacterium]